MVYKPLIEKRANELKIGDKVIGNTNHFVVLNIRMSPGCGWTYPILDVKDAHGVEKSIDTCKSHNHQDTIFYVENPDPYKE